MSIKEIIKTQTQHGPVWINRQQDILQLKFDKLAIQSEINIRKPHQLRMKNLQYLMGILLFIEPPSNVLLLGVGGGSLIQFLRHHMPQTHITGVEYDAELLQIAQNHLLLPGADQNINYQVIDAREYLAHCQQSYDLIIVDIFDKFESPKWLLQNDFINQLKSLLSPRGAVGYNLLFKNENSLKRFYKQMREKYARQTLLMETEEYQNILIYAFNSKPEKKSISEYMQRAQYLQDIYALPFHETLAKIYSVNTSDAEIIY